MFGYHDHDRCAFDLWSPVDTNEWHPHQLEIPNHPCATENRAFSPYAKHTQECEDIVAAVVEAARSGEIQMTFDLDDCFSESDCEYIKRRILDELG